MIDFWQFEGLQWSLDIISGPLASNLLSKMLDFEKLKILVFRKKTFFFKIENFEKSYFFRKSDFSKNLNFQFFEIIFWKKYFLKIELWKKCHKKFSAVTFREMNIFWWKLKHSDRHDRAFSTRPKTSKTDHYAKSYPIFSLGGASISGTQFSDNENH